MKPNSGPDFKGYLLNEPDHQIVLGSKNYEHSQVLANVAITIKNEKKFIKYSTFHVTNPVYDQPTAKGIKTGDSYQSVLNKYGDPATRISLGNGAFLHYKQDEILGMIFQFDGAYKLRRWCIYQQKEK